MDNVVGVPEMMHEVFPVPNLSPVGSVGYALQLLIFPASVLSIKGTISLFTTSDCFSTSSKFG